MNNNLSSSFFLEFLRKRGLYTDVKSVSPGPSTTSPTLPPLHFFQNLRQKHPESPSQRSKTFNLPFYSPAQSAVVDHGSEFKLGQSSMQSITSALQAPRPCSSISNQKLPYFCSGSASQDAVVIPTVPTQFLHLAYSSYVEGMHAVPSERILTLPIPAGDARIPPEDSVASFRTIANMPSQDNFDHQIQLPALSQREDQAKSEQILTHPGRPSEQSDEDLPFPNLIGRTERSTLDTGVPTGLNECNLCPKGFKRKHDLRRHVAVYHQNTATNSFRGRIIVGQQKKSFACEECGSSFGMSSTLDRHRASRHNLPAAVCSLCGQTFAKRSQKTRHVCPRRDPRPS